MTTAVDSRLTGSMLPAMVAAARDGVENRRADVPIEQLEASLQARGDSRPFGEALTAAGLSVIAEFKRRSPSAGDIAMAERVADQVRRYQNAGAAALSILTDETYFAGRLDDLQEARQASDLPILRKDFIVDRYQLLEAAVFGADAVLLIVAALDDPALRDLFEQAKALDLDCIVEVRTEDELGRALQLDADIIGINNRDLDTLKVNVEQTFELLTDVPTGKTVVSESGIETPDQVARLKEAGVDAVLIGHFLLQADDPEAQMRFLLGDEIGTREHNVP